MAPDTADTVPDWDAALQRENAAAMLCSPYIRGKAVGLLGEYLWRHEAGSADHALVLLASILSRGCQPKVTCSRAGRSCHTWWDWKSQKGWRHYFPAFSTNVLPGLRV